MSPLLVVGHRLTPHRLHRRPLAARLPVIVICLPHIRVSERSESTILTLSFGGRAAGTYQHQAAQSGPSVGCPNLGLGPVGVEMASAHADERMFDPMHKSAVFAWSSVHDRGGAHSPETDDFPPGDGRSSSPSVSQMATNTIGSSIPAPRRALLLVLVFCPNDAAHASMQRAIPAHGADMRDVGYGRIS